jgi:MFS family permease
MDIKTKWKIRAVMAGFFMQLMMGSLYTWGNIMIYVTSYFRMFDPTITLAFTFITLPIQNLTSNLTTYPGTMLAEKIGSRGSLTIGTCLIGLGIFSSSFVTNYYLFLLLYGICFGLGMGMSYSMSLMVAWSHMPEKKGFASGIITSGFGFAICIFSIVQTKLINPDNLAPDVRVETG